MLTKKIYLFVATVVSAACLLGWGWYGRSTKETTKPQMAPQVFTNPKSGLSYDKIDSVSDSKADDINTEDDEDAAADLL